MRENIFTNLIKNEDSFTEGLVNLIGGFEQVREVFCELLCAALNDISKLEIKSIETQKQREGERPDIVLLTKNQKLILIEVKKNINIPLQVSQSNRYKNFIADFKKENPLIKDDDILFLIPHNYRYICNISNNKIIKWEDLLTKLRAKLRDKLESEDAYVIKSFIEIVADQIYDIPEVRMDLSEVKKMAPELKVFFPVWKIMNIIKAVEYSCRKKSIGTYESYNEQASIIGIYHKGKQPNIVIGFGVWDEIWEESKLPLCIYVYITDAGKHWNIERCKEIFKYLNNEETRKALNLDKGTIIKNSNEIHYWVLNDEFYNSDEELGTKASKIIQELWKVAEGNES
ncbi:hypothetical protein P0082_08920 [Candidatus Haliotispira prima]|uniref:PD-(D/E)XK nuclease superfamily protein n=1 Tax=Candidatus Haliotispira prima TaxID=3034016 RepID=A0ABY8MF44_9SPIO|nr:hypothetical protein P0082_08920 [Candidatus Haliotispira prima]